MFNCFKKPVDRGNPAPVRSNDRNVNVQEIQAWIIFVGHQDPEWGTDYGTRTYTKIKEQGGNKLIAMGLIKNKDHVHMVLRPHSRRGLRESVRRMVMILPKLFVLSFTLTVLRFPRREESRHWYPITVLHSLPTRLLLTGRESSILNSEGNITTPPRTEFTLNFQESTFVGVETDSDGPRPCRPSDVSRYFGNPFSVTTRTKRRGSSSVMMNSSSGRRVRRR